MRNFEQENVYSRRNFITIASLSALAIAGCTRSVDNEPPRMALVSTDIAAPPPLPIAEKPVDLIEQLQAKWHEVIDGRQGSVDIAAYDLATGRTAVASRNINGTYYTASIVKLAILEKLLLDNQSNPDLQGAPITQSQLNMATPMIAYSDNTTAQSLWNMNGRRDGMQSFFNQIGAGGTVADTTGGFGLTATTALDQLQVLKQITGPGSLLNPESVAVVHSLLGQVIPGQRWGINGGLPPGMPYELKNGWLPNTNNTYNSIGIVYDAQQAPRYLLATLTKGGKGETDAKETHALLSAEAWRALGV